MSAFDVLYRQTVTLFNRYVQEDESVLWIPTVLKKVHLVTSREVLVQQYGDSVSDNAQLNVRFIPNGSDAYIEDKKYVAPKVWSKLTIDNARNCITFGAGEDFDFIYEGEYDTSEISDSDYTLGFFNYMNNTYDDVYGITDVSKYDFIPHFEITAK